MESKNAVSILLIILTSAILGCSGSDIATPVAPDVSDRGASEKSLGHSVWSMWQFTIDPEAKKVDAVMIRAGDMHLNALHFLEPPANLNLTIEGPPFFSGGTVTVDIGLRHPFLGLQKYTGFDVKGILIGNGSESIFGEPGLKFAGDDDIKLLNADGYIRWWNPSEFPPDGAEPIKGYIDGLLGTPDSIEHYTATLNPYKYYCDDLADPDDPLTLIDPEGRGTFSAGQKNVRKFIIDYSTSGLTFNYAIDASWKFPIGSPPFQVPEDFPPDANQPEPYRISIHEIKNTLAYEPSTGVGTGELLLSIDVYDWFDADSDIVTLFTENGELATATSLTEAGGGVGYSTYEIETIPQDLTSTDDIPIWIFAGCTNPVGYQEILPGEQQGMYFRHSVSVDLGEPSIDCGESVHVYDQDYPITGVTLQSGVFLGDIGLQEVGPHAGKVIMQTSYDKFSAVDISPGNYGEAVEYFTYSENNFHHSVDCCPFSGRLGLADPGNSNNDEVDIFDVDGNKLTTYVTGGGAAVCVEFDSNGDMWVLTKSGSNTEVRHFMYEEDDPWYTPADYNMIDLSSQFPSAQGMWLFGDIAIDHEDRILYVMGTTSSASVHYLAAYDISGTPVFLYGRNDVFSGPVVATMHTSVKYGRRLDIEIDHSLTEYCRIVVSGQVKVDDEFQHELVRLDSELNTMDVFKGEPISVYQVLPSQFVISPFDPHDLIATPQNLGNVMVHITDDW